MPDANDMDLVREFARTNSEAAFTELVRRHLNLVYSVARRCTGTDSDAQDVTQAVFLVLTRKAAGVRQKTVLPGWLYETTRYTAAQLRRTDARRHAREQEAYMQSTLNEADPSADWEKLSPHLETAMDQLAARDRALVVMRFYENKSGPEAAALLGIREDAAHKRLARAIEKLRRFFVQRGVTLTATAIASAVAANSVQSAPAGLTAIISGASLSGISTTAATVLAAKTIAMTTLQKTLITAALAVTVGAGIFEAKQAAHARAEMRTLRQQQAPLAEQVRQLQSERNDAINRLALLSAQSSKGKTSEPELLKLRGEVNVLQRQADEAAKRAQSAEQQLAAFLSSKDKFSKHEAAMVDTAKEMGLAMFIYARDNAGKFPADFQQLTNQLGDLGRLAKMGVYEFDRINIGSENLDPKEVTHPDHPKMVVIREQLSRQSPDGTWSRIYGFADGSVVTATTYDGNFDAWEKANTYTPPPTSTTQ